MKIRVGDVAERIARGQRVWRGSAVAERKAGAGVGGSVRRERGVVRGDIGRIGDGREEEGKKLSDMDGVFGQLGRRPWGTN